MRIKKVLNSSVVVGVDDDNQECILLGKGIGYGKKVNEEIESDAVDQIFISLMNPDAKKMLEMFSSIPPIYLELTQDIVNYAEKTLDKVLNEHIYLVLTDHLHFAVQRFKQEIVITNRLAWEMKSFYRNEYNIGLYALQLIKSRFFVSLPEEEAANIAFHIVNAEKDAEAHFDSMKAARIMGKIVHIINYSIPKPREPEDIHYIRFIRHVQYFVERYLTDKLLKDDSKLFDHIRPLYPQAIEYAERVRTFFIKNYEVILPDEEVAYLAVHIERLMK